VLLYSWKQLNFPVDIWTLTVLYRIGIVVTKRECVDSVVQEYVRTCRLKSKVQYRKLLQINAAFILTSLLPVVLSPDGMHMQLIFTRSCKISILTYTNFYILFTKVYVLHSC